MASGKVYVKDNSGNVSELEINIAKIGTATVGSHSNPVFLNSGSPTASTITIGSHTQPIFLNGGTITQSTASYSFAGHTHNNYALDSNVVKLTGDQNVAGNKIFTDTLGLKRSSTSNFSNFCFYENDDSNTAIIRLVQETDATPRLQMSIKGSSGTAAYSGPQIWLRRDGGVNIRTTDTAGANSKDLLLKNDGTLTWNGTAVSLNGHTHSNYALDSNVVKLTGDQNVGGVKTFTSDVIANTVLSVTGASLNLANPPTSAKEYWPLTITRNPADTTNSSGRLGQFGVQQPANSNDFRFWIRAGNPRGGNLPTSTTISAGTDDSDASTGNCWGGIGVFYDYSKNRTYPEALNCTSWGASDDSDFHLASTKWVRTATGNTTLNAATATKLGSSTIGGTAKPIYLNGGTATAISATVGSNSQPVWLNGGTISACTTTFSASGHTHNYAGSSSAGGYANGALLLRPSNIGNGNYSDVIVISASDKATSGTQNRVGTIRIFNNDGNNQMLLGVHNESNGAPSGLTIRSDDGVCSFSFPGTINTSARMTITTTDPVLYLNESGFTKGSTPSSTDYVGEVIAGDKNGGATISNRLGALQFYVNTSGNSCAELSTYENTSGTSTNGAVIKVWAIKGSASSSYVTLTNATPPAGDNSTKVPTTGWVTSNFSKSGHTHSYIPTGGGSLSGVIESTASNTGFKVTNGTTKQCSLLRGSSYVGLYDPVNSQWVVRVDASKSYIHYGTTSAVSDKRNKKNIIDIPDDILNAWGEVEWKQFNFKDIVNDKTNIGLIAQDIEEVFNRNNLKIEDYPFFEHEIWEQDGEHESSGDQYYIHYTEALCMESAYQRRRADRLEKELNALKEQVKSILEKIN